MGNKTGKGVVCYTEYENVYVKYDDDKSLRLDFVNSHYFKYSVKDLFENGQEVEFRFAKDYELNLACAIVELKDCPTWYRIENLKRFIELNNYEVDRLLKRNKALWMEIKVLSGII